MASRRRGNKVPFRFPFHASHTVSFRNQTEDKHSRPKQLTVPTPMPTRLESSKWRLKKCPPQAHTLAGQTGRETEPLACAALPLGTFSVVPRVQSGLPLPSCSHGGAGQCRPHFISQKPSQLRPHPHIAGDPGPVISLIIGTFTAHRSTQNRIQHGATFLGGTSFAQCSSRPG